MRKAGIDRNIRMVIFGHSDGNDMDSRYDTIDRADLLDAVDKLEEYLKKCSRNVHQAKRQNII